MKRKPPPDLVNTLLGAKMLIEQMLENVDPEDQIDEPKLLNDLARCIGEAKRNKPVYTMEILPNTMGFNSGLTVTNETKVPLRVYAVKMRTRM